MGHGSNDPPSHMYVRAYTHIHTHEPEKSSPQRQEIAATNASSHLGDLRGRSTCQAGNGPDRPDHGRAQSLASRDRETPNGPAWKTTTKKNASLSVLPRSNDFAHPVWPHVGTHTGYPKKRCASRTTASFHSWHDSRIFHFFTLWRNGNVPLYIQIIIKSSIKYGY